MSPGDHIDGSANCNSDVDPNALTADPISLRLGAGQCGGVSDESIDLPQQDVLAIVVHSACTLPGLDSISLAGNQTPGFQRCLRVLHARLSRSRQLPRHPQRHPQHTL